MESYRHRIYCIGCNVYDDPNIPNLNWAETDALALADAWLKYENADVSARYVLASGQFLRPTRSNVLASLDSMRKAFTKQDVLWFSFSGHGVVTNDTHRLILSDTRLSRHEGSFDLLEQTSLDLALIERYLRHTKAGYIVMLLDCCVDIIPDSERSLRTGAPKLERGQDLARIGVLWSQRAKEASELKDGALTRAWLDTLLAPERLAEPKHQTVSVYFQSLRGKYQELRSSEPHLNLPPADVIYNADRWHMPTLKARDPSPVPWTEGTKAKAFRIDFPTQNTDGRLIHYAYGVCNNPSDLEAAAYYVVLQDRPSALYCQYPPIAIGKDGRWRTENVVVGHGITHLHIVEADAALAAELQHLNSQNYFGALPGQIADRVTCNIVASVRLKPYGRDDISQSISDPPAPVT